MTNAVRNAPQEELTRLATAASEALTDSMVERLTGTGANALEVVDKLNNEETREAIMFAIDRLTDLYRVGALETLFSGLELLHASRMAMTDNMVDRLFLFGEHMVNNLGTEELASMAHNAREALEDAIDETADKRHAGGLFSTISMLSKPETQHALNLMLTFACKMQKRAVEMRGSPELET
jgi:uncharacterized protein YjgD (DUF1641 family)